MQVALAQFAPELGQVDANVSRAGALVEEAVARGADLVVLPELALSGYAVPESGETAIARDDPRLGRLAKRAGSASLAVGFHERGDDGRMYSSMAWSEGGRLVAVHRKLFLSGGRWAEARRFASGDTLAAFDTRFGRVAQLVCNDAWQPVAPWLVAQDGAELVVVSAASADPLSGEALDIEATWNDLLIAIARLHQVVVVFVNRVGEEDGLRYWGGSRVVDPRGRQLARAGRDEGLTIVEVELDAVAAVRAEYDVAGEPRLDLVASVVARLAATNRV